MEIKGKILDSTNQPLDLANITIISGTEKGKFGTYTNEEIDDSDALVNIGTRHIVSRSTRRNQ